MNPEDTIILLGDSFDEPVCDQSPYFLSSFKQGLRQPIKFTELVGTELLGPGTPGACMDSRRIKN